MITGQLRSQIDQLWLRFHSGGITNPLTVIEQISYLMFARLLDLTESRNESRAARLGQKNADRIFPASKQNCRWGVFCEKGGEEMFRIVRDELFPFFRGEEMRRKPFGEYLKDAQLMIPKASLLAEAVEMIKRLPLTQGDTKGDLYEYLLSKLTTAGIAGQFRTPRHIIRAMVEMVEPQPTWRVSRPRLRHRRLPRKCDGLPDRETLDAKPRAGGTGQRPCREGLSRRPPRTLPPHIQSDMLYGFDFDVTMLRIAAMNLMLHGIDNPSVHYQDTLAQSFAERYPKLADGYFDLVVANPPFKGSLDSESVHSSLKSDVKTKKTELLFLALMLRLLRKPGGKCAVIVPDGVLFGSSQAHRGIRQMLVDDNQLEAVVSLPSGVFKPYAGVSTAILIFTRGGRTDNVWFYKVEADGYSLDDKRAPVKENDLPDLVAQWNARDPRKHTNRAKKAFFIPVADIRENRYDLSINRYKEIEYEEVLYDPPLVILDRMEKIESEISVDLKQLRGMLK
jgi:type I restriction enzyme M protein